jgi:hypothetical protein
MESIFIFMNYLKPLPSNTDNRRLQACITSMTVIRQMCSECWTVLNDKLRPFITETRSLQRSYEWQIAWTLDAKGVPQSRRSEALPPVLHAHSWWSQKQLTELLSRLYVITKAMEPSNVCHSNSPARRTAVVLCEGNKDTAHSPSVRH